MPSPEPEPDPGRLCVFGDSQIASVKRAFDRGLLVPPPGGVEFWGATGPQFRRIHWRDGRLVPEASAAPLVAVINGTGRETLCPGDFKRFVFYGARLRVVEFLAPYLHRACTPGLGQSRAVLRAAALGWLGTNRAWYFARHFVAAGAEVTLVPSPLPTDGIIDLTRPPHVLSEFPAAARAGPEARDALWCALEAVAEEEGIGLLRQPDATVTRGVLTKSEFAVGGAAESRDAGHKSAAFAALRLQGFLDGVRARAA